MARRWLLVAAASGLIALLASGQALRATGPSYPTGDHAVLELYTLYASEGPWPLGPYSRYAWHHPGPLFFYWELPWYLASGQHTLGMNAGALALSTASLAALLALLVRFTPAAVSLSATCALGAYTLRLDTLSTDFWNPLAIVLPMPLLLVLGAGVASGRWQLLPWMALVASFLAQTHVSVVPAVAVVSVLALVLALRATGSGDAATTGAGRAMGVTVLVLAAAWALPVVDSLRHRPGNLATLVSFFLEPAAPVPWSSAAASWSGQVTAMFRPGFALPVGVADGSAAGPWALVAAGLQVVALAALAWRAHKAREPVVAALGLLGTATLLVTLWSLSRVRGPLGDYLTFWLSAVAALNWALIVGSGLALFTPSWPRVVARVPRAAGALAFAVVALVAADGVCDIRQAARDTRGPATATAREVRALADAIDARLRADGHVRPRLRIAGSVWAESAGVVLKLRKRGVPVTADGDVDFIFSAAPTGNEDASFGLTDAAAAAALGGSVAEVARGGRVVIVTSTR